MADVTIPAQRANWLDRPVLPSLQRLAGLAAHWETIAYSAVLLAGFLLRFWDVGARAVHHDESLHSYYSWLLYAGHGYSYDPLMHGPFQFEVIPIFYLLFGVSDFSARLLAVVLGTGLIALPYFLRRHISRPGALLASIMIAISPGMVYFSRFVRDDIYLACFTLGLFICIVRYLESRQGRYLYAGAALAALAMASMEAAYLTFFIFGSFLAFEAMREALVERDGPVLASLRATSLDTWLTAVAIFVVLTVLMFSTFFTNPYGIWDPTHPLCNGSCLSLHPAWSSDRKDILGGIAYWLAQHSVQRGGQPWFYYFLVLPLYEQLAVIFGLAGLVYATVRRSLVTTFLVWWAALSIGLYSWAGEKMPWLSIHITLPLLLLAGLALGAVLRSNRGVLLGVAGATFAVLFALEVHSTFALNFQDAANPTEMLIYVQSSQDVKTVVSEVAQVSARLKAGTSLQIGLDDTDVGGWPFIWYFRDYPNLTETSTFNGPVCGGTYCPVLILLENEYDASSALLNKHYVVTKYRWNWWFPEDYKDWFPQHVGSLFSAAAGQGTVAPYPLGSPSDWEHLWNWLIYRQPFGYRGARWMYFLVRRDLVPNARYYSGSGVTNNGTTAPPQTAAATLPSTMIGVDTELAGPRGIAASPEGTVYVADPIQHTVSAFSPFGRLLVRWGSAGTGPGQFNSNNSPMGVAVGGDGLIYVADTWNQRIQVFTPGGRFVRQWGGGPIGAGPGQFYGPRSLAVTPDGRVFVADTGNKRIEIFTRTGRYLGSIGSAGAAPGQFEEPSAVAAGPGGNLYVADFWNQRIQEFSSSGHFVRMWGVADWPPQSYDEPYLAIDPRTGNLYASDPAQRRVLVYSPAGRLTGAFESTQLSLPVGVAALGGPRVAVSDPGSGRVFLFDVKLTIAPTGTRRIGPIHRATGTAPRP